MRVRFPPFPPYGNLVPMVEHTAEDRSVSRSSREVATRKNKGGYMAFIYKIVNDINDKLYIGKTTTSLERRFSNHISDSKLEEEAIRPLYLAFNKYGVEHFSIHQIEECSAEEASEREKYWINYYDSYNNGYNATLGGEGAVKYNYKEISEAYIKFGTAKQVCDYFNCSLKVVQRACQEYNVKIQDKTFEAKEVAQVNIETKEIVAFYPSAYQAAISVTGNAHNSGQIVEVCNQKRVSAYNYYWIYKSNIPIKEQLIGIKLIDYFSESDKTLLKNTVKKIAMIDKETKSIIKIFDNSGMAADYLLENNYSSATRNGIAAFIRRVCKKDSQTAYGFIWNYVESL